MACEEDPGRSFLSRGAPQPVGDQRTTQRGVHAADAKERSALTEPRIDDKHRADVRREAADAGADAGNQKLFDQQPFDVGHPPVLGPGDRRSLDAGPDAH